MQEEHDLHCTTNGLQCIKDNNCIMHPEAALHTSVAHPYHRPWTTELQTWLCCLTSVQSTVSSLVLQLQSVSKCSCLHSGGLIVMVMAAARHEKIQICIIFVLCSFLFYKKNKKQIRTRRVSTLCLLNTIGCKPSRTSLCCSMMLTAWRRHLTKLD